jgi:hypothetical protein
MAADEQKPFFIDVTGLDFGPGSNPPAPPTQLDRLRTCLLRYIRPIMVESALRRVEQLHGPLRGSVEPERLARAIEEVMIGLRMFVKEDQLPQLMIDLAEIVASEEQ